MKQDAADKQKMIFAKNLNRELANRKLTQDDLAKALNCSASTVSDWCNAKKYPRVNRMQQIADYLGVSMTALREPPGMIELSTDAEYNEYVNSLQAAISSRIKQRMRILGLEPDGLRTSLGISQQKVNGMLDGKIAVLSESELDMLAIELRTTVKYLTLKTDDPYDYDRDPDALLSSIPSPVYVNLEAIYGNDTEMIWKEWNEGRVNERYQMMKRDNPELYFTLKHNGLVFNNPKCKPALSFYNYGNGNKTEALHLLEPIAKKIDSLPSETRDRIIELFNMTVDVFLNQNENVPK